MVAEKSGPSFASILTILSIVLYTGGFLRLELEFNEQKDKINQLESVVESMKTSETRETTASWDRQGEVESKASWDQQDQRVKLD